MNSPRPVSLRHKLIAWCCIAMQIGPSVSALTLAFPAQAGEEHMLVQKTAPASGSVNPSEQDLASGVMSLGTALSDEDRTSSEALSDYARGQAGSAVNSTVEGWLSQFGTVRSQINLGEGLSLEDSSLDMLLPLYDSPRNMLFTQLGARRKDDRTTLNIGLGSRFFPTEAWMFGLNSFLDSDVTGKNYRLGVGAELWADYLKMSANSYHRLSGWHQSRDFGDYDERPANGYDLRINSFLPSHPQLGGKLVWEQYFGDEVALFGNEDRQKDPYAVTMGLNYTPIPMLTFGTERRMGKSDMDDFSVNLEINYMLDKTWQENTSPDMVDGLRKLARSRYDLIERNNNIILEYRKQQVIKLNVSPEKVRGESKSTQNVTMKVSSKYGTQNINWSGNSYTAAGGSIKTLDARHVALTLPAYQVAQNAQSTKLVSGSDAGRILNTYVLTAIATDIKGNKSSPSQLTVEVLPPTAKFSAAATVINDNAPADGVTPVTVVFHVTDSNNRALVGEPLTITTTKVDGSNTKSTVSTDAKGEASVDVTSLVSGESTVLAQLSNGGNSTAKVHFTAQQPDAAHSALNATPTRIIANGKAVSTLALTLHDSLDRPVTGRHDVALSVSEMEGVTLGSVTETSAGVYSATLSGTTTGVATIVPKINGQTLGGLSAQVTLTADESTAQISAANMIVTVNNVAANGTTPAKVQVTVTDANGNPVAGQDVAFSADNNAVVAPSGTTDSNGVVTILVTNTHAGVTNVTATINGSPQTVQVSFTADSDSAQLAEGSLAVVEDNAHADNKEQNRVEATVTDSYGNPLAGQTVTFSVDNSATITASAVTDAQGKATAALTSTVAAKATVTASVNNTRQTAVVTFVASDASAQINSGALTVTTNGALANGTATNSVKVTITDSFGNVVPNYTVSFTADNGATITASAKTNQDGEATAALTSMTAGNSTVSAQVNDSSQSVVVNFVADSGTAQIAAGNLTVTADNALANGTATNSVQVKVTDANGNALGGQKVGFSADNGAVIAASGTTDADGTLTLPVTSLVAGTSSITAEINGSSQSVNVTFVADSGTTQIAAGNLTVTADNALANGSASNSVQVKVTDANGNALGGQTVGFSADNGAVIAASGTTDADGTLTLPVTSLVAGTSSITAEINGSSQSVNVIFVADNDTAQIAAGNLTVTADNALANGTATNSVQVKVTDANGNALGGQKVGFSADNGAVIAASGTTDADGTVTLPVTSLVAGTSSITAEINGSSQSVNVTFVADSGTAQIAAGNLTVINDNAIANGSASNLVQVKVTDANDNPLEAQKVSFTADNGAVIAANGTTRADGTVTLPVTSTLAGASTITATVNGSSQTVVVTFVADAGTAVIDAGNLTVVSNDALANGTATNSVQAKVTDTNGNPIAGLVVNFVADNGAIIDASGTTSIDGLVLANLHNTQSGVSNVTATVNGSSQTVQTTFTADDSTAQIGAGDLSVVVNNAATDGKSANQVQVKVTDANGNPLAAQRVNFTADNGAIIEESGTTDTEGLLIMSLTNIIAGDSQVTASINGSSQSVVVSFVADGSSAQIAEGDFRVTADNALANGIATNSVQVKVTDANGNPLAAQTVAFSADNSATITASGTTDTNGLASVNLSNIKAGVSNVTATLNGGARSVQVTFVADANTAQIAAGNLTVTHDNALANNVAANKVQVNVTDANGNPLAEQNVSFTADNGATVATNGTTGADGTVTLPITSLIAGTSNVTASINGSSQSVVVTFVADSGTATIDTGNLTVSANNALANGTATNSVKAQVTDANGNPVAAQIVNFTADNGAIIAATGTTDVEGFTVVTLTSVKAGTSLVTATVNGHSQNVTVIFVADNGTAQIAAGNLTVTADNALANGTATNSVQVKVTDANGNALGGQTVGFSADNGAVIAASGTTDADGTLTLPVTSLVAGTSSITAEINGSSQSVNVTFVADSGTAQIAAGNLTVTADNALANGSASNSVQVKVTDANGNALGGQKVSFTADNGAVIAASGTTDADGTLTLPVTSLVAGTSNITAEINGSSQSVNVTFVADNGTAQIAAGNLTVTADNALANGSASNSVQVKVTDANGNALGGQKVSFTADNGAVIAASGTTDADGTLTLPVTSLVAGTSSITAEINGSSQSVNVTFVADNGTAQIAAGNLTVTADNALANGTATNSVQVKVTDANGNALGGQKVGFSADNGAVIAASGTTDADGTVTLPVTSLVAGTSSITAEINGSSQSVNVIFVADSGTAQIAAGNLTVTADNALANGSASNSVQVKVTDANGNALGGQKVGFSADNGAVIAASGTTDADGTLTLPVTSLVAGTSSITAEINGSSQSVVVNFIADASTATIVDGALTVVQDNAITDGTATNSVKAIVTDANGNRVPDATVTFTADNDSLISSTGTTDTDGSVVMTLTSTHAGGGVSNVTASTNVSSQTVQVTFVGSLAIQSLGFENGTVNQPGGKPTAVLIAKVVDSYNGKPLANQEVDFTINNGAHFIESGAASQSATTDDNGLAKIGGAYLPNVKYSASSFSYPITAKSGTESTSITALATGLMLYPNRNNKPAGGTGKNTDEIYAKYRDVNGKWTAGIPVYASVAESTASWVYGKNGTADSSKTNSGGTVSLVIRSSVPGDVTVSVSTGSGMSDSLKILATFN